jgi:2-succinyl-5-enolpyruvyl-6-hydroxy-3-cyclohexene-1-carboxylate synthase
MAIVAIAAELAQLCAKHGIENVVVCPGSRSASLSIAMARHPSLNCYSISDERSAGFIALGMAIETRKPVAIICTSGSAAYNFAPAVAEAFFQEIPLIVITADRPMEWIHQNDGQTMYQNDLFGKNCKKSYQLLSDTAHTDTLWHGNRTINEGILLSQKAPQGPVHFNIHIREPFYPETYETYQYQAKSIQFISPITSSFQLDSLKSALNKYSKILILIGQRTYINQEFTELLDKLKTKKVVIIADLISNTPNAFLDHDLAWTDNLNNNLHPELLITCGQSVLTKKIKQYFQNNKPQAHWHIQEGSVIKDPLQSIDTIIEGQEHEILSELFSSEYVYSREYYENWLEINSKSNHAKKKILLNTNKQAEISQYAKVLESMPANSVLHLANSMAVRYTNIVGVEASKNIEVRANRGISGIDGCTSTALGAAIKSDELHVLFTGDVAFQYDINAFWNNYIPNNFKIIIFNNAGGGIFRLIPGPSKQKELNEFFVTDQKVHNAELFCKNNNISYISNLLNSDWERELTQFFASEKPCCLELFSEGNLNLEAFEYFKNQLASIT